MRFGDDTGGLARIGANRGTPGRARALPRAEGGVSPDERKSAAAGPPGPVAARQRGCLVEVRTVQPTPAPTSARARAEVETWPATPGPPSRAPRARLRSPTTASSCRSDVPMWLVHKSSKDEDDEIDLGRRDRAARAVRAPEAGLPARPREGRPRRPRRGPGRRRHAGPRVATLGGVDDAPDGSRAHGPPGRGRPGCPRAAHGAPLPAGLPDRASATCAIPMTRSTSCRRPS